MDGVLILDKPQGMSSNQALQKVRWLFQAQKGGHTGSLDPLATGVLPICLGEASKLAAYLLDADKVYQTTAQLGVITASGDSEGEVLETRAVPTFNASDIEQVLARFRGCIEQVPTMFSALKHQGRPLYEYARQGLEVERKARRIKISQLRLDAFDGQTLQLTVHCSKGTYIRSLVEDIGLALGCGAHVTQLRRTQAGHFDLSQAHTLPQIIALREDIALDPEQGLASADWRALDACLLPADCLVPDFPAINVNSASLRSLFNGQIVKLLPAFAISLEPGALVRIYDDAQSEHFLGMGEVVSLPEGVLGVQPRRLLHQPDAGLDHG